jgi:inner membrane protein
LFAETRAGWRAGANHGEISPEDRSLFDLKTSAPRRLPAVGSVRCPIPHFRGPAPAIKYTYIDAFNGKSVTRETLLRYLFKSLPVNVLIRGFLWKT